MVVTLLKNRFIIVFIAIICIISLTFTFTGCMYGTYIYWQNAQKLTSNETILEDETGKYIIKFHQISDEYGIWEGGSWYEKSTTTVLFTFKISVFGIDIYVNNTEIGHMDWEYEKNDNITVCNFYNFYKNADITVDENLKFLYNQEFVFKEVSK